MSKLTILKYPDPRLRTVAKPIATVTVAVRTQIDDMLETMYESNGVGLARLRLIITGVYSLLTAVMIRTSH